MIKKQLLKRPPIPKSTPKKFRNRTIKINGSTLLEGAGIWTNPIERGRKCQICRQHIPAGTQSLRYIRYDLVYGKYHIDSEKAICPSCAIPTLEKIIEELKKPQDLQMFFRMKKNQPQPQTQW